MIEENPCRLTRNSEIAPETSIDIFDLRYVTEVVTFNK
jgi:hypothetical protein